MKELGVEDLKISHRFQTNPSSLQTKTSLTQKISKIFEEIDIFGQPILFTINKKSTFRSTFGGLMTVFLVVLGIVSLFSFGKEVVLKENPFVFLQNFKLVERPFFDLGNKENFVFSFRLEDGDANLFYDPSVFYFDFEYRDYNRNADENIPWKSKKTKIKLENCTIDHFQRYKKDFYKKGWSLNQCIAKDETLNVGGSWEGNTMRYLKLRVFKCKNETAKNGIVCKSPEEINNILKSLYFSTSFENYRLNLKQKNPFTSYIMNYYVQLDPMILKKNYAELKGVQVNSDNGVIFTDLQV